MGSLGVKAGVGLGGWDRAVVHRRRTWTCSCRSAPSPEAWAALTGLSRQWIVDAGRVLEPGSLCARHRRGPGVGAVCGGPWAADRRDSRAPAEAGVGVHWPGT